MLFRSGVVLCCVVVVCCAVLWWCGVVRCGGVVWWCGVEWWWCCMLMSVCYVCVVWYAIECVCYVCVMYVLYVLYICVYVMCVVVSCAGYVGVSLFPRRFAGHSEFHSEENRSPQRHRRGQSRSPHAPALSGHITSQHRMKGILY